MNMYGAGDVDVNWYLIGTLLCNDDKVTAQNVMMLLFSSQLS